MHENTYVILTVMWYRVICLKIIYYCTKYFRHEILLIYGIYSEKIFNSIISLDVHVTVHMQVQQHEL